jgi:hypothetical protein
MNDDTFDLLSSFRAGLPELADVTVARVYRSVTSGGSPRWQPSHSSRLTRRPRLLIAVATAALIVVPAAVAVGGRIIDLFDGAPPPPAVTVVYETGNRNADAQIKAGVADHFPKADVSKLHGVIEIQTADGPQDLWAAPNDSGGQCIFVDFANDPATASGKAGNGTCDSTTSIAALASKIDVSQFWMLAHPDVSTAYGRVYVPAASVKLRLADASTVTARVVESFFLVSLKRDDKFAKVTAYDASGTQVAEWMPPH